jgi:hypothetical protein
MNESPLNRPAESTNTSTPSRRRTYRLYDLFIATAVVAVLLASSVDVEFVAFPLCIGGAGAAIFFIGRTFDWRVVLRGAIGGATAIVLTVNVIALYALISEGAIARMDLYLLTIVVATPVGALIGCAVGFLAWVLSFGLRRAPISGWDEGRMRVWSTALAVVCACGVVLGLYLLR